MATEDSSSSNSRSHEERSRCCFQEWMQLQRQDLTHLLQSLHNQVEGEEEEESKKSLIRNCISHFQDYISTRTRLAEEDASPFFAPTWCTSLENSLLWITGCRPSIFIRLVYALSGCEADARLSEWLQTGVVKQQQQPSLNNNNNNNSVIAAGIGELSPRQMTRVNGLHMRTIKAEEKLTNEMASSQEDVADQPIAVIISSSDKEEESNIISEEAEMALKEHEKVMGEIMEKADELRLKTLKELVLEILNPIQALHFLVAAKKLHLSLHQWGKQRDQKQGRFRSIHTYYK